MQSIKPYAERYFFPHKQQNNEHNFFSLTLGQKITAKSITACGEALAQAEVVNTPSLEVFNSRLHHTWSTLVE